MPYVPDPTLDLLTWGYSNSAVYMAPQRWQPLVTALRSHNLTGVVTTAAIQQMLDAGFGPGNVAASGVLLSTAPPDPGWTSNQGRPNTVDFTAAMADTGLADGQIAWDFGDGTTGRGARIQHKFRGPGTYKVKCTVTVATVASSYTAPAVVT